MSTLERSTMIPSYIQSPISLILGDGWLVGLITSVLNPPPIARAGCDLQATGLEGQLITTNWWPGLQAQGDTSTLTACIRWPAGLECLARHDQLVGN